MLELQGALGHPEEAWDPRIPQNCPRYFTKIPMPRKRENIWFTGEKKVGGM